jgi:hypothetical protein
MVIGLKIFIWLTMAAWCISLGESSWSPAHHGRKRLDNSTHGLATGVNRSMTSVARE